MGLQRHMNMHLKPIPKTGVAYYDRLVYETQGFQNWGKAISAVGVTVKFFGARADFDPVERVMYVNPQKLTYLDLLHESRHVMQWQRALRQHSIDLGKLKARHRHLLFNWLEGGPYKFELRLHERLLDASQPLYNTQLQDFVGVGFRQEYIDWVNTMLYDPQTGYWSERNQRDWMYSPTISEYMRKLWN